MNNPGFSATPPPPAPPAKSGPSCWALGGIGCLVIFVIAGALIGYGIYKGGPMFGKVFSGGMALATNMQAAEKDLVAIRSAILSYDSANGQYPNTLTELVPKYLPDASELHSALDANPSPTHVSFTYAKPTSNATSTSPLVDIAFVPDLGVTAPNTPTPQMSTSQWFLSITVGGQLVQATYVNGKLNSRQNIPTPPGQP